jgi:HK97 family phage major capsid protein
MSQILLPYNAFRKPVIETRSMPTLLEQRNTYIEKMDTIVKKAKEETRSLSEEENTEFETAKTEVEKIDKTIQAEETANEFSKSQSQQTKSTQTGDAEKRSLDEAKFLKFIKGEERALDVASNGAIIPETIADRIIMRVKELSPIYQRATVFNVGGDLVFPKYDPNSITASYVNDMTNLVATNGNFTTVKLTNFIAGALTQISRSLLNRQDFDLVNFIVQRIAQAISDFLERELLLGVGGTSAATGIFVDADITAVTAGSATAIVLDDLVKTQMTIPEQFQPDACWIMNKSIFQGIRLLKGTDGYPLLNQDVTQAYGWTLLGKPVFITESAPSTIATGLNVLAYGDMSGLYVKLANNVEVQVLNELYSTQYAVGVVGYVEFDSKVVEPQRITRLKMA